MRSLEHFVARSGIALLCLFGTGCAEIDRLLPWDLGWEDSAAKKKKDAHRTQSTANAGIPRPAKRPVEESEPKPGTEVAAVTPADGTEVRLAGLSLTSAQELLGDPSVAREEGMSLIWIYERPECSLQIYFYPDIETQLFHALQYEVKDAAGAKLKDDQACLQHIQSANRNGQPE